MPKPKKTDTSKEELKRKLKEKMMAKRIGRMGRSQQQSLMHKELSKVGIDPDQFIKKMKENKK
jgi:hypothetical protein